MRIYLTILVAIVLLNVPAASMVLDQVGASKGPEDAVPDRSMAAWTVPAPDPIGPTGSPNTTAGRAWAMFRHDPNGTGNTSYPVPMTNQTLWTFNTSAPITSTPAVVDGTVYFNSGTKTYAVFMNNGTQKWNATISTGSMPSSPAYSDGTVYAYSTNGKIYALWATNGTTRWTAVVRPSGSDGTPYASPIVAENDVFFAGTSGVLFSINKTTGTENWNKTVTTMSILGSPAYRDGKIYLGLGYNNSVGCYWASNGTEIWNSSVGGVVFSTPALGEDRLFVDTQFNELVSVYLSNGTKIWNVTSSTLYSSPGISGDKVFVSTGAFYQSNGTNVWSKGYHWSSSPALSMDKMVILNSTTLTCYYQSNGTVIWEKDTGSGDTSPVISNGLVFVGSSVWPNYPMYAIGSLDITPPNVMSTSPANQSSAVAINSNITMTFSEAMYNASTELGFSISPGVTGKFAWNGATMTFDPDALLASGTAYTVKVAGTAEDLVGNTLDGNYDGSGGGSPLDDFTFTFTTGMGGDFTPPNVTAKVPGDLATGIAPDATVQVTFSEAMNKSITEMAFGMSPPTPGAFSWDGSGRVMTFTPSAQLRSMVQYNCTVGHLAADIALNLLDGNGDGSASGTATDDHKWSFTTKDHEPPTVVAFTPLNGSVDIPMNAQVTVLFNESMDKTATEGAFSIGPAIAGTYSWVGNLLTFAPTGSLLGGTNYTVNITTAAKDETGNLLDGDKDGVGGEPNDGITFVFRTGALAHDTVPTILSVTPLDGATDVPVVSNVTATFSEDMNKASVEAACLMEPAVQGTFSWNGSTITFSRMEDLATGTVYNVTIKRSAADLFGLNMSSDHKWSFTTEAPPSLPPQVAEFSPDDGATGVDPDESITINFTKPMGPMSVQAGFSISPQVDGSIGWSGSVMTFDPTGPLAEDTDYTVRIKGTVVDTEGLALDGDGDGNSEGSPADDFVWGFRTREPVVPPVVPRIEDARPWPGVTTVPPKSSVYIIFTVPMARMPTEVAISSEPPFAYTFDWSLDSKELTINHSTPFPEMTVVTFTVLGSAQSAEGIGLDGDGDGVAEGAGADDYVWSFTTGYPPDTSDPPSVLISEPADGSVVDGKVRIAGSVADPDTPLSIIRVELMFDDDGQWKIATGSGNWSFEWDTTLIGNGPHKVAVRATDGVETSEEVALNLVVKNEEKPADEGTSSSMGMFPFWLLIVVALVVAGTVATVMTVRRRTKDKRGPPPANEGPRTT